MAAQHHMTMPEVDGVPVLIPGFGNALRALHP